MTRRDWRDQALCTQINPDVFAPDICNAATIREPKATCGKCPVETHCLEEALVEEQGLPPQMRCGIRGGKTPRERAAIDKLRPATAARLPAVKLAPDNLSATARIDGTGTRRRLQALVAEGWPPNHLATRFGRQPANFERTLYNNGQVKVGTARATITHYEELRHLDPRDHGVQQGVYDRVRRQAAEAGWAPVAAWDDDQLDDLDAYPDWTGRCGTVEGNLAHHRRGIPVCQPCRQAQAARPQQAAA